MSTSPRYTPERFALVYPPLKAKGMLQMEIAKKMGISDRTLRKYLADPDYVAPASAKMPVEREAVRQEVENQSEEILRLAYEAHRNLIKHYTGKKGEENLKKAAWATRAALSVCRTEADLKRVFAAIQVNIDNRQQSVQVNQGQCFQCATGIAELLCKKCQDKVLAAMEALKGQEQKEAR